MKLLTTRSVDYFEWLGHDFWKETLVLSFYTFFWCFEHHKWSVIYFHYIQEKTDISMAKIENECQCGLHETHTMWISVSVQANRNYVWAYSFLVGMCFLLISDPTHTFICLFISHYIAFARNLVQSYLDLSHMISRLIFHNPGLSDCQKH